MCVSPAIRQGISATQIAKIAFAGNQVKVTWCRMQWCFVLFLLITPLMKSTVCTLKGVGTKSDSGYHNALVWYNAPGTSFCNTKGPHCFHCAMCPLSQNYPVSHHNIWAFIVRFNFSLVQCINASLSVYRIQWARYKNVFSPSLSFSLTHKHSHLICIPSFPLLFALLFPKSRDSSPPHLVSNVNSNYKHDEQ